MKVDRGALIDETMGDLATRVGRKLRDEGWRPAEVARWKASFTRPLQYQFVATAELVRTGRVHLGGDDWPLDVYVRFGCGFVPATRLMARLGLDVELSLVEEFPVRGAAEATARLVAPDDVGEAANEISSRILSHDLTFARSLASVDRMASALRDRSLTPLDVEIELLPILMAAGNRGEEAVALLEAYVRPGSEDASDGEYRQFARRLQRYVLHGETA